MGRKAGWRSLGRLALVAASILSSCFLLTEGQTTDIQLTVLLQPEHPIVGQDVTLIPQGSLENAVLCRWYRGQGTDEKYRIFSYYLTITPQQTNGPTFTGRETGGPGCTLHIRNLTSEDSANYTVIVDVPGKNVAGRALMIVSVVLLKPTVSVSPSTFPIEFTVSVQLTCKTNSRYADVRWLWNGEPLNYSSQIQPSDDDWILDIKNISRNDAGIYQCQVSNFASNVTSDITYIDVIYGPDTPEIQPDTRSYNVHSDIKLNCAASSFPIGRYSWFFNEMHVANGTDLLLQNVSREQTGNYTCQVMNDLTHRMESTTLEIEVVGDVYDVTIAGPPKPIENWLVILNCTSVGTNVSYSWFKGDQLMEPGDNVVFENNNQTLVFIPSNRNDTGNYTCYAFNKLSSNSSEPYWLEILYGPDAPVIYPQETVYSMGFNLSLSCFATSNPPAKYSWYHNEQRLGQQNTSQLLIWDLSLPDEGNYTCKATNEVTGLFSKANLKISLRKPVTSVTINGPDKAIEQNVTVLTCSSDGTNVSYYWLEGSQTPGDPSLGIPEHIFLSNDNKTLTFNPTMRGDSGNYTCYGYNNISEASANHTLDVFYGPDVPIIYPDNQSPYYAEGATLSLSCEAASNPAAQFTWLFNDTVLIENQSQLLRNGLNLSDSGNYTCRAFNNETGRSTVTFLEIFVQKPVTSVTINGPDKAIEQNVTVLTCTSDGTNVSYYWLEGSQTPGDPSLGIPEHIFLSNDNKTLIFNPTMRGDSGNYTCYGYNSLSNASANYTLDVFYGPDVPIIYQSNQSPYYAEGATLSLSCEAASNPAAQFSWLFNDTVLIENQSQLLRNGLNLSDAGNYTCRASNNETGKFNVTLMEIYVRENLSSPVLWASDVMVKENTNVTLNCSTSNSPDVSVSWFKEGEALQAGANFTNQNRTLTLYNVTKNDAGLYRCQASNLVSNPKSNPLNITVAYGPDIKLNPEGTIEKSLNSDLKLECSADSVPAAQLQWFFNNTKRDVTGSIFHVLLTNWTDEGSYSCQATNPYTLRNTTKTVYVKLTKESGSGGNNSGLSGGAIAGIVIGSLAGVALVSGLLYFICTKTSFGRMEQPASNGNVPSAPGHNQGVTDTKPKAAEEDLQYSILAFKDNNHPPPPRSNVETPQPSDGVTIYSEIKKK